MNSPFTPKKHSCLKEGVTRQELLDTLEQIKVLKMKTASQIKDYEKTIDEQNEKICYLQQKVSRSEQQVQELYELLKQKEQEANNLLLNRQNQIKLLTQTNQQHQQHISTLQRTIKQLNATVQSSQSETSQLQQCLEQSNNKICELNQILHINIDCDLQLLTIFKQSGGIRAYFEKQRQQKLNYLEQKHQLNENIRKLQFELKKTNNQKHFDDKVIAIRTKQVENLQENINVLRQSFQTVQVRNTTLEKQIDKKNEKIEEIMEQIKQLEGRLEVSMEKRQKVEEQLEQCHRAISNKQNEIINLNKMCQMLSKKRNYDQLVETTIDQSEEQRQINKKFHELTQFKQEYYRNVDKIQYLCEMLDS